MNVPFRGLGVALATPFHNDGMLDTDALQRLTEHVTRRGADFVVALGSTGEAAMLTEAERDEVVQLVRRTTTLPVLVGTGAPATAPAVQWTIRARELGAAGALAVVPPYTKPTQAGLVAHFAAIAAAAPELPIMLYNVPGRTGTTLEPGTLAELWSHPNVVAIKESSGDLQRIGRIASELPAGKLLFAGDDALALPTIAVGGHGLVSVAGNVVPDRMKRLVTTAIEGDGETARELHAELLPLFDALSLEPNPIPIKAALELIGLAGSTPRLPLLTASTLTRERLQTALARQREVIHG